MHSRLYNKFNKYVSGVERATALRGIDYTEEKLLWDFRREETLQQWSCISDEENGGQSKAVFEPNKKGTGAIFKGILSTTIPQGTGMKYSGYCAIRSQPKKSGLFGTLWERTDVSDYDAFQLRVRGDGRKFFFNLQSPGLARKDDVWQYFVFTKGGPEWENITISFGDFFLTHRGYIQDHQMSFPRQTITTMGLLLVDRTNGPFSIEIQHIKAVRSLIHKPDSKIS